MRREHTTEYIRPPLPSEYREVNYLISPSSSYQGPYIDTRYKATNKTKACTKTKGQQWIFGGRTSAAVGDMFGICLNAGDVYMQFGDESPRYVKTNIYLDECEWELSQDGCFLNGVQRTPFQPHTFIGTNNIYLFQLNNNGVLMNGLYGNMWYFQLFEDGVIRRDYVPVIRIADNKPGMWDFCQSICPLTNSPFYVKAGGSGEFSWN